MCRSKLILIVHCETPLLIKNIHPLHFIQRADRGYLAGTSIISMITRPLHPKRNQLPDPYSWTVLLPKAIGTFFHPDRRATLSIPDQTRCVPEVSSENCW